ncbi:ubiquitin-activating enzyme E1C [Plasmodium gonderi]|uniref:NEDD8-activating enzyme E1 catalytic subunit n=1 Tax=Plasmodium gonderi TaxID=77519 RepID=A0A1Y1JEU1_PLAGO|nr:ubiquitin-activating enzyme E1C [Plasmodium gonderi]GAW79737.1 ubiquitin-activating enzyme E1C [Plasmodium gonderi]
MDPEKAKVLVVGCGGLGNEVIKNLIYENIKNIAIVDYDTVEMSNLNRQFFFSVYDIGRNKASVIQEKIKEKYSNVSITSFVQHIEYFETSFFENFDFVMGCLDNISSRIYLNNLIFTLKKKVIYIDGGVEGFHGSIKIVNRDKNFACFQCTIANYAMGMHTERGRHNSETIPLCTISGKPQNFTDCVFYAMHISFERKRKEKFNLNDENHIRWIYEEAKERASQFHIENESYTLTKQVIQNSIPTTVSTLMIIASLMTNEVHNNVTKTCRRLTHCASNDLNDYSDILYAGENGFYFFHYKVYKNPRCIICSKKRIHFTFDKKRTLGDFIKCIKNIYHFERINISSDTSILFTSSKCLKKTNCEQKLNLTFQQLLDMGKVKQHDYLNLQMENQNFVLFLQLQ